MSTQSAIPAESNQIIEFNKPFLTGHETRYIEEAVRSFKISGNGGFTKKCHEFFKERFGFKKALLTSSCTDALEMAALLLNIVPGDEVIVPSYTFVSSANAFVLRGAEIVFADSSPHTPNIDAARLERLISSRTKAIVVVHYAGFSCDLDAILEVAKKHGVAVIEDAAHSIDSYYRGQPLGSFGQLATFSFHETKNIICGEGGLLVVNDPELAARAEILWEKGTNRAAFFRGEVDKYTWVDVGSSFLPSEIVAAFLYAQLENLDQIQEKRREIWNAYYRGLKPLAQAGLLTLPQIPDHSTVNGHLFYVLGRDGQTAIDLKRHLKERAINAVTHYVPLHLTPYHLKNHARVSLPNAERYAETLLRLPLYYELTIKQVERVVSSVHEFFEPAQHDRTAVSM